MLDRSRGPVVEEQRFSGIGAGAERSRGSVVDRSRGSVVEEQRFSGIGAGVQW